MNENVVRAILRYGDRYRQELLLRGTTEAELQERLLGNWWPALDFFFGRAFYQGRRDTVSEQVQKRATTVLTTHYTHAQGDLEAIDLNHLQQDLAGQIGRGKIGKQRDIEMVLSTLRVIQLLPDHNLVRYSRECIRAGHIAQHYDELQAARNQAGGGITQVGPKIAALYLRDVVSLFHLESAVPVDFQFCLQPVDTWVRQLGASLSIALGATKDLEIQQAIIQLSQDQGCSPLTFNQGLWYLDTHSLPLLIELLTAAPNGDGY